MNAHIIDGSLYVQPRKLKVTRKSTATLVVEVAKNVVGNWGTPRENHPGRTASERTEVSGTSSSISNTRRHLFDQDPRYGCGVLSLTFVP